MIAGEHKQLHAAEPAIEIWGKGIKRDTKFWDENVKKKKDAYMPEEDAATAPFSLDRRCIFSCLWMSGLNRALPLCACSHGRSSSSSTAPCMPTIPASAMVFCGELPGCTFWVTA